MANPVWPTSLPTDLLIAGYSETFGDESIRTPMDVGPVKMRRRFTASVTPIAGTIILQQNAATGVDQVGTLRSFFKSACKGGSLPFDWHTSTLVSDTDSIPDTDTISDTDYLPLVQPAATFRFVAPPQLTALGGGWYNAALSLEIMP